MSGDLIMRMALCFTALCLTACKNPLVVKEYLNVISLSPSQGATQVDVDTNIIAGFSEPLVANSIDSQSVYIQDLDGNPIVAIAAYEAKAHWVVLDPEASLTPNTTYVVTFTSAIKGEYSGNLLAPVQTQFTTTGTNPTDQPPTAQAGGDREVRSGDLVTLSGSASADPEGNAITYQWRIVSKPASSEANLSTATGPETAFTADIEGEYLVGLVVNDGSQDSSEDFAFIKATKGSDSGSPPDSGEPSGTDTGASSDSDSGTAEDSIDTDTGI